MKNIYKQEICDNCLQALLHQESNHTTEEMCAKGETLEQWAQENYHPAGLSDNQDPFFSQRKCDLCGALPGNRYEYNFVDKNQERVKFLVHPENPEEVFAYFPDFKADQQGNMTSYAHVGQHSACAPAYAEECRKATKKEYQDLREELKDLKYKLIVV